MRALIVRPSSIGDVIHSLPALAALHRDGWQVGWLVEPAGSGVLGGHPLLAQLTVSPPSRSWRPGAALTAVRSLRSFHYDVALDFSGLWKSAAWARLLPPAEILADFVLQLLGVRVSIVPCEILELDGFQYVSRG